MYRTSAQLQITVFKALSSSAEQRRAFASHLCVLETLRCRWIAHVHPDTAVIQLRRAPMLVLLFDRASVFVFLTALPRLQSRISGNETPAPQSTSL